MALLMVGAMVDTYVPLFGQQLAHLTPVAAGFLGAALAVGWTVSEIISASLQNPRTIGRVIAAAPVVLASGLALGALTQRDNASLGMVPLWTLALLIAGTGIGMAWPHLSVRAMDSVNDPAEGGAAAAAINIVQLVSGAFGAGLAGVVVNMAQGGGVPAVHGVHRRVCRRCRGFVRRGPRRPSLSSAPLVLGPKHRHHPVDVGENVRRGPHPGARHRHRHPHLAVVDVVGIRVELGELPVALPGQPQQFPQYAAAVFVDDGQPQGPRSLAVKCRATV